MGQVEEGEDKGLEEVEEKAQGMGQVEKREDEGLEEVEEEEEDEEDGVDIRNCSKSYVHKKIKTITWGRGKKAGN